MDKKTKAAHTQKREINVKETGKAFFAAGGHYLLITGINLALINRKNCNNTTRIRERSCSINTKRERKRKSCRKDTIIHTHGI